MKKNSASRAFIFTLTAAARAAALSFETLKSISVIPILRGSSKGQAYHALGEDFQQSFLRPSPDAASTPLSTVWRDTGAIIMVLRRPG